MKNNKSSLIHHVNYVRWIQGEHGGGGGGGGRREGRALTLNNSLHTSHPFECSTRTPSCSFTSKKLTFKPSAYISEYGLLPPVHLHLPNVVCVTNEIRSFPFFNTLSVIA